jgi:hypothetical protein
LNINSKSSCHHQKIKGENYENVKEYYFQQKLDHYNNQEKRTWNQRYYVNDTFYNPNTKGPIFFELGGEGDLSPFFVTGTSTVQFAQKFGALVVSLEHRFYGKSKPTNDLSTSNLQYLSSQQALADAAYFILEFKKTRNAEQSDVVTFGCSYSGALAAWFRIKYPHITVGSVASSAPVLATLDFFQYLDVVEQSLSYFVGIECDNKIQEATNTIENLLKSDQGKRQLEQKFNTCDHLVSDKDIATFLSNIIGDFQGVVQYNDESKPMNVKKVCDIMTSNNTDPVAAYAKVASLFSDNQCLNVSYSKMIQQLQDTVTYSVGGVGLRQWTYQSCNEFGYFQTTDSKNQPFGDLVPIDYYVQSCIDAFGIDLNPAERVNFTNDYYGGNTLPPTGPTNIAFVNGNIDPWHSLSITADVSNTLKAIYIDGTAHCRNVYQINSNSPQPLVEAVAKVQRTIGEWLQHH